MKSEEEPGSGLPGRVAEVEARPIALAIGICLFFILVSALTPLPAPTETGQSLQRPGFEAPTWLVLLTGVVYYPLFAALLYRAFAHISPAVLRRTVVLLLGSALAVNALWNALFGNAPDPLRALSGAGFLVVVLTGALAVMFRKDRLSAAILAPYLLWVLFDFAWSFELWRLNAG